MFGLTDLIVYLWLFPVTLFIILPLAMLSVWSVARLIKSLRLSGHAIGAQREQLTGTANVTSARA